MDQDPSSQPKAPSKKTWRRRLRSAVVSVTAVVAILGIGIPLATHGPDEVRHDTTAILTAAPPNASTIISTANQPVVDDSNKGAQKANDSPATLRVLTLNLAHGRGEGLHQSLQKREEIESHLNAAADVVQRERPDVVAMQEADGPSAWSGDFNHVEYLARRAGLGHFARGEHVKGLKLSYGTALASRGPLDNAVSVTFPPSPPTFSKGFTVGTVAWPGRPDFKVDVVSVHLDFLSKRVREKQVDKLAETITKRGRPVIVMGDFNCDWDDSGSSVRRLAEKLELRAYRPEAADMPSFPTFNKRLDWVLLSPSLEFVEYRTLDDAISDHRGVLAVVRRLEEKSAGTGS